MVALWGAHEKGSAKLVVHVKLRISPGRTTRNKFLVNEKATSIEANNKPSVSVYIRYFNSYRASVQQLTQERRCLCAPWLIRLWSINSVESSAVADTALPHDGADNHVDTQANYDNRKEAS